MQDSTKLLAYFHHKETTNPCPLNLTRLSKDERSSNKCKKFSAKFLKPGFIDSPRGGGLDFGAGREGETPIVL